MEELTKHERRVLKAKLKKEKRISEARKRERNRKLKKFAYPALGITLMALLAFLAFGYYNSASGSSVLRIEPESFDFGSVSQSKGIVSREFQLSNTGQKDLIIENIVTSCMCTTAVLEFNGKKSPVFGMHSNYPDWSQRIRPREKAKLEVFYDPNVHPELKGRVTRTVSIYSNDPLFLKKDIKITAYQTR